MVFIVGLTIFGAILCPNIPIIRQDILDYETKRGKVACGFLYSLLGAVIGVGVAVSVGALFGILEKGNPHKWGDIIFCITVITAIGVCLSWSLNTHGESELVLEKEQPIYAFDDQEFYIQKSEEPAGLIFSSERMKSVYSFVTENENGRIVQAWFYTHVKIPTR